MPSSIVGFICRKEWTDDPDRLKAAHVPDDAGFATKPQIARRMIARSLAAEVPFAYVAADSVYGTGDIETMLRKAGKEYVLGVAANHVFRSWGKKQLIGGTAAKIAQNLPKSAWRRRSSGEGTKGPRLHEWAYLELADLDAADYNSASQDRLSRTAAASSTPIVFALGQKATYAVQQEDIHNRAWMRSTAERNT